MGFRGSPLASMLAVFCLHGSASATAQEPTDTTRITGPSFWHAAAGVTTANWLPWAYNWYVQRWHWANVGTQSWGRNLQDGFVWDNDCFLDNQLAHPIHGSFYHNSARASGYGFWGSFPFVAGGSASWELFGENITPSLNDLINTTFGGIAIGEASYRLGSLLASKSTRPEGTASMAVGRSSGHSFFDLAIQYGSPFEAPARPYDAFELRLEVAPGAGGIVRRLEISGMLAHRDLTQFTRSRAVLGLFQHFDYEELSTFRFSGQSVSGAVLYQRQLGTRSRIDLGVHLEGVLLGSISSDHGFYWRRDYDLGPGAGMRLGASFTRDRRDWLRLDGRVVWIHSVHGSDADHFASVVRAATSVPLVGPLGIGGDLAVTTRHSIYRDYATVTRRVPQMRAYLTWAPN